MNFYRGDIYEYLKDGKIRYALIVANESRRNDKFLSTLVLTPIEMGGYTVPVETKRGLFYADCKILAYTTEERLGEFVQAIDEKTLEQIDKTIIESLGIGYLLENEPQEEFKWGEVVSSVDEDELNLELQKTKMELGIYKNLYEDLLKKLTGGK